MSLFSKFTKNLVKAATAACIAAGMAFAQTQEMTINCIECVWVEAGTFIMGSPADEPNRSSDETQHEVTLTKDYWIGKYPVTQKQYQDAIGSNPSDAGRGIGDDYPVNTATWDNATAFCTAVGGRLLTEAEWEYAARGGKLNDAYKIYSGSNDVDAVAWYSGNSGSTSHPVGQKLPNELGIYDMSGNVYEWVNDYFNEYYYDTSPQTDPIGPIYGSFPYYRVARGGSGDNAARFCRIADRSYNSQSVGTSILGFRVAFNSYKVTFNSNGGSAVASIGVLTNGTETIAKSADPTREGYVFAGWFADGNLWDFENDVVTQNITLNAKWKVAKPTAATNLVYTGGEQSAEIEENADAAYTITGDKATNAGDYSATVSLDKDIYVWADGTDGDLILPWAIAKAAGADVSAPTLASKTQTSITIVAVSAASGQEVNYAINTANSAPTEATAWSTNLTFAELLAGTDYYVFARAVENDNYNAGAASAGLSVKTDDDDTPIKDIQKSDGRTGIRLSHNVVSDKAEIEIILPSDKVLEAKVVVYDNVGNVVFETSGKNKFTWDLTNIAGRNVANGTYLIVVEAKGAKGNYAYSAKVGVRK